MEYETRGREAERVRHNVDRQALRSCVKVEVVLGSPSPIVLKMVSVDVKQHLKKLSSCVNVEVAVLGSPSLISLMVSVDIMQHLKKLGSCVKVEVAVLGFPSQTVLSMVSGRTATLNLNALSSSGAV